MHTEVAWILNTIMCFTHRIFSLLFFLFVHPKRIYFNRKWAVSRPCCRETAEGNRFEVFRRAFTEAILRHVEWKSNLKQQSWLFFCVRKKQLLSGVSCIVTWKKHTSFGVITPWQHGLLFGISRRAAWIALRASFQSDYVGASVSVLFRQNECETT